MCLPKSVSRRGTILTKLGRNVTSGHGCIYEKFLFHQRHLSVKTGIFLNLLRCRTVPETMVLHCSLVYYSSTSRVLRSPPIPFHTTLSDHPLNLLKPSGQVMHQQFKIQQLYALPTLYLCVLYLSENKQRLVSLTA